MTPGEPVNEAGCSARWGGLARRAASSSKMTSGLAGGRRAPWIPSAARTEKCVLINRVSGGPLLRRPHGPEGDQRVRRISVDADQSRTIASETRIRRAIEGHLKADVKEASPNGRDKLGQAPNRGLPDPLVVRMSVAGRWVVQVRPERLQ